MTEPNPEQPVFPNSLPAIDRRHLDQVSNEIIYTDFPYLRLWQRLCENPGLEPFWRDGREAARSKVAAANYRLHELAAGDGKLTDLPIVTQRTFELLDCEDTNAALSWLSDLQDTEPAYADWVSRQPWPHNLECLITARLIRSQVQIEQLNRAFELELPTTPPSPDDAA